MMTLKRKMKRKAKWKNESPKHTVKKDSETLKDMDSKPVNSAHHTSPYTFTKMMDNFEKELEWQSLTFKRKVLDILYEEVRKPDTSELL